MGRRTAGFTIVELLVVMAIILVLVGLVLGTSGYVHNKAARSRAEAEIAAISVALENYKADNGVYPSNGDTDTLNARVDLDSMATTYQKASLYLYGQLSGDADYDRATEAKSYFSFKDNQLNPATGNIGYIKDPFGNSYGYSTKYQADVTNNVPSPSGYNPTFDLWSTAGYPANAVQSGWVKNW